LDRVDGWAAAGICAATVVYLLCLPRWLDLADESFLLYEAKRIRDGEVMYRDFFQFVTPLASYSIAALFWLFGTTLTTARAGMAVVHGITAGTLYAITRQLGVRRALAISVPLAYLGICQTVWPVASWHWFSTCYTALLLWALVTEPAESRWWWPLGEGVIAGLLTGTQQQKGAAVVAGVCALFAVHAVLDYRYGLGGSWRRAAARLGWFTTGVGLIMLPLLATFVALAGAGPVYDALVRFPLENYHTTLHTRWGATFANTQQVAILSFPPLLRVAPFAMLLPVLELAVAIGRRSARDRARRLASLLLLSSASILSIWYFPSLVHIGFIAAPLTVCAAEGVEWACRALRLDGRRGAAVTTTVGAAVALALVIHLATAAAFLRQMYPVPYESAFGHVDLAAQWQAAVADAVRKRLDHVPGRVLFCYRHLTGLYLLTGGRNPTPYQYLDAQVSPAAQVQTALDILAQKDIPFVVLSIVYVNPGDPIVAFLQDHYRVASEPTVEQLGGFPGFLLFERRTYTEE
jgi:hypothetical protein